MQKNPTENPTSAFPAARLAAEDGIYTTGPLLLD
jgi:hypothetical protein